MSEAVKQRWANIDGHEIADAIFDVVGLEDHRLDEGFTEKGCVWGLVTNLLFKVNTKTDR